MNALIILLDSSGKAVLHPCKASSEKEFALLKQGGALPGGAVRAELWTSDRGRVNIAVPVNKPSNKPTNKQKETK